MPLRSVILSGACVLLTACSTAPIPVATTFDYSVQKKVRSAGHWEALTGDVAKQTIALLQRSGVEPEQPLYVSLPESASAFEHGFREMLITKLVSRGRHVLQHPQADALQLSYSTQLVVHRSVRPQYVPGQFTLVAAGLMAAYGLRAEHLDSKLLATLGLTGAADLASSLSSGGATHTELILSTAVLHADRYLSRTTDVYYLEDADTSLFVPPPPPLSSPYPVRSLEVVTQ